MEKYYGLIILIATAIYKIYSNYKKEMENAAKRNPSKRSTSTPPIPIPYNEMQKSTPPLESSKPTLSKESIPEEVVKIQERKKELSLKKKYLDNLHQEDNKKDEKNIEFDLRQAVIQAAILERPYK